MTDITQLRKLAEQAIAEDKALRQQLADANRRIAELETELHFWRNATFAEIEARKKATGER